MTTKNEPQPNFKEDIIGGHPSAHAEAYGMTEDDLVGGKLKPGPNRRLEDEFRASPGT